MPTKADRDTVLDGIHRTREQIAEKFGGDLAAILEDASARKEASGRPVWRGAAAYTAPRPSARKTE